MEKEKKSKSKSKVWIIVLCVVLVILINLLPVGLMIFGIFSSTSDFEVLDDGSVTINDGDLTIKSNQVGQYNEKDECYYVEGLLTNNTDDIYEYIDLTYTFYDDKGYILGNSSAYLEEIGKDDTWRFKVGYCEIDSKDVSSFKFDNVYLSKQF